MRRENLHVNQPCCIALSVREQGQREQLQPTAADEYFAQPHLEAEMYHLRALDKAQLCVIMGGVQVDNPSLADAGQLSESLGKNIDDPFIRRIRL